MDSMNKWEASNPDSEKIEAALHGGTKSKPMH